MNGANLTIHLKNSLGPNEKVVVTATFDTIKDSKPKVQDFGVGEVFVESEVGAAALVRPFQSDNKRVGQVGND